MATKGQKFKRYSPQIKKLAVEEYNRGNKTRYAICQQFSIASQETLIRWVQIYHEEGEEGFHEKRGRATSETAPFKGRPKTNFPTQEEQVKYQEDREKYLKERAILKEQRSNKKHRIK